MNVPVHPGGRTVEDLEPIHARIALSRLEASRDDHGKGDEGTAIQGPAFENGDAREVDLPSGKDHFLAGSLFHLAGKEPEKVQAHGQQVEGGPKRFGGLDLDESPNP